MFRFLQSFATLDVKKPEAQSTDQAAVEDPNLANHASSEAAPATATRQRSPSFRRNYQKPFNCAVLLRLRFD